LVSNVRSCDRALANSNKAIEIDPICEGRFAAPHESASVKGFGYWPMTTVEPGSRPVSESLQGKNPREISNGARHERYGDFWFLVGVALGSFGEANSVLCVCKGGGRVARISGAEREGRDIGWRDKGKAIGA